MFEYIEKEDRQRLKIFHITGGPLNLKIRGRCVKCYSRNKETDLEFSSSVMVDAIWTDPFLSEGVSQIFTRSYSKERQDTFDKEMRLV